MEFIIVAGIFALAFVAIAVVAIVAGVPFKGKAGPDGLTVETRKK
jgi:hypothetical protein